MRKVYLDTKTVIFFGLCLILSLESCYLSTINVSKFYINSFNLFSSKLLLIAFFCFMLYTNYKIVNIFKNNECVLLRKRKKSDYFKLCISNTLKCNLLYFILFVIIDLVFLYIISESMGDVSYLYYDISRIRYLSFYLIRMFCFLYLFSVIIVFLMTFIKNKITYFLPIIFISAFFCTNHIDYVIDSIFKVKLNFAYYFRYLEYSSFNFEVVVSLIYIFILILILFLIIRYFINRSLGD